MSIDRPDPTEQAKAPRRLSVARPSVDPDRPAGRLLATLTAAAEEVLGLDSLSLTDVELLAVPTESRR